MSYQKDVADFMRVMGDPVADKPTLIEKNEIAKRAMDLIREEAGEAEKAIWSGNIEEIAKELADLIYVTMWAANAHGIPMDRVFTEVHESNLTKLGNDGKPIRGKNGKVLKGPNFRKPDLSWLSKEAMS